MHSLFKSQEENAQSQYIWKMALDLVGTGTATGGVDKAYETVKEKLQPYGTLSPPFVKAYVSDWRKPLQRFEIFARVR